MHRSKQERPSVLQAGLLKRFTIFKVCGSWLGISVSRGVGLGNQDVAFNFLQDDWELVLWWRGNDLHIWVVRVQPSLSLGTWY